MLRDRCLCWKTILINSEPTFLKSFLYLLSKYLLFLILIDCALYILNAYWCDALSIQVNILSLEPLSGSNRTKVVFSIDPDTDDSEISSTYLSLIRSIITSLVTNQFLSITKSTFGEAYSFEVLKFPGGITIIPPQSAFLLQKVQILFNFTLNFSIHQIQVHFSELTSQLKAGLRLAPYEVLSLYLLISFLSIDLIGWI